MNITKIYLITNCYGDPNKVYIGKTKKKYGRKGSHKKRFGKEIIYTYIDELNSIESKDWKPLECYWISQFKEWGFEIMNKNEGGNGADFQTKESNEKRSNALKGKPNLKNRILKPYQNKPILQYDFEGNFIREWKSITHASKYFKIGTQNIIHCLRNHQKTTNNFVWRYKLNNFYPLKVDKIKNFLFQYNKNGEFIKKWNNQIEVYKILKINNINISNCIKGRQKTAGGYIWKYE